MVAPGTLAVSDALDALDAIALPVGPSPPRRRCSAAEWEIAPRRAVTDAVTAFLRRD
jgi:hypothetical protein